MDEQVIPFKGKDGRYGRSAVARIRLNEDSAAFSLQIEMENDCAITLMWWKNGDRPTVAIWTGNGEHEFGDDTIDLFRIWAELATGNKSVDEYGKSLERILP